MHRLIYILICLIVPLNLFGQEPTQIVITSIEQTDRTFHKKDKLFLEGRSTKHKIVYTLDTTNQSLKTKKYLLEKYFSIWDRDTIVKEKVKIKYKKWSAQIDSTDLQNLLISLKTDVDALEKNMTYLHTSHHYLSIYIDLIQGSDTTKYNKTKPFDYLTPWFSEKYGAILNPAIDQQILRMLPNKFIGREKLETQMSPKR